MTVELIFKARRNGPEGESEETSAVYNTYEEALLQAAHNEIVLPGITLRIEDEAGKKLAGPADFKKALKVYREARNESLSINDQGVVDFDSAHHAARMKDVK